MQLIIAGKGGGRCFLLPPKNIEGESPYQSPVIVWRSGRKMGTISLPESHTIAGLGLFVATIEIWSYIPGIDHNIDPGAESNPGKYERRQ